MALQRAPFPFVQGLSPAVHEAATQDTEAGKKYSFPNKAASAPQTAPCNPDPSKPPEALSRVKPEYPPEAIKVALRGIVKCRLTVNETGEVYEARALVGHRLMRQPALNAVLQWKFKPLLVNGRPMPFVTVVTVTFEPYQ